VKGYLVDTNIPSELTYPKPEPLVAEFVHTAGKPLVSLVTFQSPRLAEILSGAPILHPSSIYVEVRLTVPHCCVTAIESPKKLICPVRFTVVAVKEKLTAPSLCPVIVNQGESLTAVNSVEAGITGAN